MIESLAAAVIIFTLRCIDVSLGTIRLILTVQGRRTLSSLIGFVEVTIFISAVASVVNGPLDPVRIVAYGAGFAAGTFVGVTLDRKLALGDVMVRAITPAFDELVTALTDVGFGVTLVEARGGRGSRVGVVFSVTHRRRMAEMMALIEQIDEDAIISVQEVRQQFHGYFSPKRPALTAMGPVTRQ